MNIIYCQKIFTLGRYDYAEERLRDDLPFDLVIISNSTQLAFKDFQSVNLALRHPTKKKFKVSHSKEFERYIYEKY